MECVIKFNVDFLNFWVTPIRGYIFWTKGKKAFTKNYCSTIHILTGDKLFILIEVNPSTQQAEPNMYIYLNSSQNMK